MQKEHVETASRYGRFRPRQAPSNLHDTELIRRLKDSDSPARLTLFDGPVGYGKSSILRSMHAHFASSEIPCIWINLEEEDERLTKLVELLSQAVAQLMPGMPTPIVPANCGPETLGRMLASTFASVGSRLEVFVDDIGHCQDELLGRFLDQWVALTLPTQHLWISTSRRLDFDRARAVTEGELRLVQLPELGFTQDDIQAFLAARTHSNLTAIDSYQVIMKTGGWPMAVALLATELQDSCSPSGTISQFSGINPSLSTFLRHQFLSKLNIETVHFALEIAPLQHISADLCSYCTENGRAARHLDTLVREDCFLAPIGRDENTFQFLGLVREFLDDEAAKVLTPARRKHVLKRASEWALRSGDVLDAVECALAAPSPVLVANTLHNIARTWVTHKGETHQYIKWVNEARAAGISLSWECDYWYVWALMLSRQCPSEDGWLESSIKTVPSEIEPVQPPEAEAVFRRRVGELRIVSNTILNRTAEAGRDGLRWLEDPTAPKDMSWATVAGCVAINAGVNFDFTNARAALRAADDGIASSRSDYGAAWMSVLAAQIDYYQAEYSSCYQALTDALLRASEVLGKDSDVVSTMHLLLSRCLLEMGMEKDAERYLIPGLARLPMHGISETAYCGVEAAIEMWDGCDASSFSPTSLQRLISFYPPPMNLVFNCFLIQRLLRLDQMEQAHHHIDLIGMNLHSPEIEVQAPSAFVLELLCMTRLEYLMSERLNREAAALCERLIETAEAKKRRGSVVELEIALATLAHRSEDPTQALRHLQRAIHLNGQRRIVRPFLRRRNVLKVILANVAEKEWGFADRDDKALLTMILQSDAPSSNIVTITHEPSLGTLTGREIELVRSIDMGLSNQQIADRLGISITTVKWHVSNIYSKLNVRNRCAAVAKARSLNLL